LTITNKPAEWNPKESRVTGTTTNEWVLDGWFQQHRTKMDDGYVSIEIWTYDADKKTYRTWAFLKGGISYEMTGNWDERSNTLTCKADLQNEITATLKMHSLDDDNREFSFVAKDAKGKIYLNTAGKLIRKK
jgi:hypothetical protein